MLAHIQKTKKTKAGVRKQERKTWNLSCPAEHIINTKESLKVAVCGFKVCLGKFWFCNITLLSLFEGYTPVLFLGSFKQM